VRVLVLGQLRWGPYLALQLNRHGSAWSVDAQYLNVAGPDFRLPGIATVRRSDVIVRMGFPVGAPSIRGRAFDFFWRALHIINPSAVYLHYWIGSDVQSVTRYHAAGSLRRGAFGQAMGEMHVAVAPWLADELRELSVDATVIPYYGLDRYSMEAGELALPSQFTVLMYIPDQRWAFYGGEQVVEAARRLPQVRFVVTAGTGNWLQDRPANVSFIGWCDDMVGLYKKSTVVLRLAQHDGLSNTVMEGLAMARHVIWNYPMPFTTKVRFEDIDGVVAEIRRLLESHDAGTLVPNTAGRCWALAAYDQGNLIKVLCEAMMERLDKRPGEASRRSGDRSGGPPGTGGDKRGS
jgi:hypothetical protein